jgi:hypothetical protein
MTSSIIFQNYDACSSLKYGVTRNKLIADLFLTFHLHSIAVAFYAKLRVATVAKGSILEGLPKAKYPLLSKNHAVCLRSCLP